MVTNRGMYYTLALMPLTHKRFKIFKSMCQFEEYNYSHHCFPKCRTDPRSGL